jgi:hypothetical protein
VKVKAHIRVAKTPRGAKVAATTKPTLAPLYDSHNNILPTVAFAVEFDVPESMFKQAENVVASITIKDAEVAADVREV